MSAPEAKVEEQLAASPAARLVRDVIAGVEDSWIVGGTVRDALLGHEVEDLDLVVPEGEERVARTLAGEAGGDVFALSEAYAAWRVIGPGRDWQVDVSRMRGHGIREDLGARDFTINAMALPLVGGELADPYGGLRDLEERRIRAVTSESFDSDPLRVLRAARLGAQLGFRVGDGTVALARQCARRTADSAGERLFAELRQLVTGPEPLHGFELMDLLGVTPAVLPELEALRGVEQSPYHHLDVHGHTLAVLEQVIELERDPGAAFGELGGELAAYLAEPLADWLSRGGALRFGALFHDLAKPQTRAVGLGGRVTFMGHDEAGIAIVRKIGRRFHTSRKLARHLELLTRHHLRLGFLVHERPLGRRAVYEYLHATRPVALDVTMLSVADRLATRGRKTRDRAIDAHIELARELAAEALAWRRDGPPQSPLRGDELAGELGIAEGPEIGRLLHELAAAGFAGEIATPDDAITLARRLHAQNPS